MALAPGEKPQQNTSGVTFSISLNDKVIQRLTIWPFRSVISVMTEITDMRADLIARLIDRGGKRSRDFLKE